MNRKNISFNVSSKHSFRQADGAVFAAGHMDKNVVKSERAEIKSVMAYVSFNLNYDSIRPGLANSF